MTSDIGSLLLQPHGPVNTGSGDQYNGFFLDPLSGRLSSRRNPRLVALDHLRWLHERFVPPRDYGQATDQLAAVGTVLLTGRPGSGRGTAGRMLLHSIGKGRFHQLPDQADDPNGPVLSPDSVEEGDRLLLDLSTTDAESYRKIQRELSAFRAAVNESHAKLVVVLAHEPGEPLNPEFAPLVVELGRPKGLAVLRRYLRTDGIEHGEEDLSAAELTRLLASAPMRDVAALARLIAEARSAGREPATFPTWRDDAIAALTDHGPAAASDVSKHKSGPERALMLAVAMLNGAPADPVAEAADRLLSAVDHPQDEAPVLERADLAEQLAAIDARVDLGGRVEFSTFNYDAAIRRHFWSNFPSLRDRFRTWVDDVIRLPGLAAGDREALVKRVAEQSLATGRPNDLIALADQWAQRSEPGQVLLPLAADLLEQGLNDERHSGTFRRQIYTWSRDTHLAPGLSMVSAQLCLNVMAVSHPEQALVRLHHLARREPAGRTVALDALYDLVNADEYLHLRLLGRTSASLATAPWPLDFTLFLELSDPQVGATNRARMVRLLTHHGADDVLVTGWHGVLTDRPDSFWSGAVRSWLQAAQRPPFADRLLRVLALAAADDGRLLGRLYTIARDWMNEAPDEPARIDTAARLTAELDQVQGFDPLPPRTATTEEKPS